MFVDDAGCLWVVLGVLCLSGDVDGDGVLCLSGVCGWCWVYCACRVSLNGVGCIVLVDSCYIVCRDVFACWGVF